MKMTGTTNHTPRAEFRSALERDVVRAFQREMDARPAFRPRRRHRAVLLLTLGLLLGAGTGFATAQVRDMQTRNELLEAAMASLNLTEVRLSLAQAQLERARRMYDAGVVSRREVLRFEAELQDVTSRRDAIALEIQEIRMSSAPVRDELWAPMVGGRDFVRDRLRLQALAAERRLRTTEAELAELERAVAAGVVDPLVSQDAKLRVTEAQRELETIARRESLRREFLEKNLSPEAVERSLQVIDATAAIQSAQKTLELANMRLQLSRDRMRIGAASELEVKRAEVELLELQLRVQSLTRQLEALHIRK
jgi:hypothetical protein